MTLLRPAFNGFFKMKKIVLYIASITITLSLVISFIYNLYLLNNTYADKIKNNSANRTLYVSKEVISENDIEKLNKLENIDQVYRDLNSFSMNLESNITTRIEYSGNIEISNLKIGNNFNDEQIPQIILPSKMMTSSGAMISLDEYYNKTVTLKLDDFEVNAYVIGIYDNINSYTTYINAYFKEKLIEYNSDIETKTILTVVVDNYNNVDEVINTLQNDYGYNANLRSTSGQADIKMYNMAMYMIYVIIVLVIIFTYISVGIIIDGIISDEKRDIAILKAIGYKKKYISKILLYRVFAIITLALIFGILTSFVLNIVVSNTIENRLNVVINQNYPIYCLITLALIIVVYLIVTISVKVNNKKLKNIKPIELLKEN